MSTILKLLQLRSPFVRWMELQTLIQQFMGNPEVGLFDAGESLSQIEETGVGGGFQHADGSGDAELALDGGATASYFIDEQQVGVELGNRFDCGGRALNEPRGKRGGKVANGVRTIRLPQFHRDFRRDDNLFEEFGKHVDVPDVH